MQQYRVGVQRQIKWARQAGLAIGLGMALSAPNQALAASDDAAAQELADQAIFTDYLQLDFKAAEKKLRKALNLCERGSCSPTVQGQVYRDLAVIYITGMKKLTEGEKLLIKALTLDPRIALDADLTTPELVRVFDQAQKKAARAPDPEPAPPPVEEPEATESGDVALDVSDPSEPAPLSSVDCPPDFPGCESLEERAAREAAEAEALADEEADSGVIKNWLSASLQQDFLMFGAESGVCVGQASAELSCYRKGDEFRNPTDLYAGNGGAVGGGFQVATTRLLLGYERQLWPNLHAGVLLGYAIGGGPAEPGGAAFVPIHAELRGKYLLPVQGLPIQPYATLGGGLAQVDSSVTTQLIDRNTAGEIAISRVAVWKKTGTTFATLGAGASYPIGETGGITGEIRAQLLFPSSGMSVALQAGYSHGF